MDKSTTNSFSSMSKEIGDVNDLVERAKAEEEGRARCTEIKNIWSDIKSNEKDGMYDLFLKEWEKSGTLPQMYVDGSKKSLGEIIKILKDSEKLIEEKKSTC